MTRATKRMTEAAFMAKARNTPRAEKLAVLRRFSPEAAARCKSGNAVELDRILYGLHLLCTSPAFLGDTETETHPAQAPAGGGR